MIRKKIVFFLPLILLVCVVLLLIASLQFSNRELLPSALIDQPFPEFELAELISGEKVTHLDLPDGPFLLNFWASWCGPCRIEHPVILAAANSEFEVVGVNMKDKQEDALAWLEKHGDPYLFSIVDSGSDLAVDLGVAGVPSTFVVDQNRVIRHKNTGMISTKKLELTLLPLMRTFEQAAEPDSDARI